MIRIIFWREVLDHLMSLRLALTLLITVALMVVNGVVFCFSDYDRQGEEYRQGVRRTAAHLEGLARQGVAGLAEGGPGEIHKRPRPLSFIASGREAFLPKVLYAFPGGSYGVVGFQLKMPWLLRSGTPQAPPSMGLVSDFVEIDWVFVIGFCLSLLALLLTYDGVCGERQAGTLRLLLAGPTPRYAVLLGKFGAAWAVLAVTLAMGLVVNLLIVQLFGPLELSAGMGARLGLIFAAGLLYLACFVGLGLLISASSDRPAACLVSLLLGWTVLLVLLPHTTAGVVGYFAPPPADGPAHAAAQQALFEEHGLGRQRHPTPEDGRFSYEYVKVFSDFLRARLALDQHGEEERWRRQVQPVLLGRRLNRLSPAGVFQYAVESLAGVGLPRHQQFLAQARRYEQTFRQFLDERDRADPESHHLFGLAAGLSSRPVPPEAVPRFHEDLSMAIALTDAALDLALLGLFALLSFLAAHLVFLRREIS